jgi:hypothetical protein
VSSSSPVRWLYNKHHQGDIMKITRSLCLVAFLFAASPAQDQIKQGVYSLGGSISYSSIKTVEGGFSNSTYALAPSISYFLIDQFELSFGVDYTYTSIDLNPANVYYVNPAKSKSLALDLGMRFYFPLDKVAPFIGASGKISWMTSYYDSSQPFQAPTTGYNFTGGLEIFIARSASIEPAMVYSRVRYNAQNSTDTFLVGIGAKYFIL